MAKLHYLKWLAIALAGFFIMGLAGNSIAATELYVSKQGNTTAGLSWANAYTSVTEAFEQGINGTADDFTVYVNATDAWEWYGGGTGNATAAELEAWLGNATTTVEGVNATNDKPFYDSSKRGATGGLIPSPPFEINMPSNVDITFKGLDFSGSYIGSKSDGTYNGNHFSVANATNGSYTFTGCNFNSTVWIGSGNVSTIGDYTFKNSKFKDGAELWIGYAQNNTVSNITVDDSWLYGLWAGLRDQSDLSNIIVKDSYIHWGIGLDVDGTQKPSTVDTFFVKNNVFGTDTEIEIENENSTAPATNATLTNLEFTDNSLNGTAYSEPFFQVIGNATGGPGMLSPANFDNDMLANIQFVENDLSKFDPDDGVANSYVLFAGDDSIGGFTISKTENATTSFGASSNKTNTIKAWNTTFKQVISKDDWNYGYFEFEKPGKVQTGKEEKKVLDDAGYNSTEMENEGFVFIEATQANNASVENYANATTDSNAIKAFEDSYNASGKNATQAPNWKPGKGVFKPTAWSATGLTAASPYAVFGEGFVLDSSVNKPQLFKLTNTDIFEFKYMQSTNTTEIKNNLNASSAVYSIVDNTNDEVMNISNELPAGNYTLNVFIEDNSDFDMDTAAGSIEDPAMLSSTGGGGGSGSSGCAFNPNAGFGMEWLLLLSIPFLFALRRKFD